MRRRRHEEGYGGERPESDCHRLEEPGETRELGILAVAAHLTMDDRGSWAGVHVPMVSDAPHLVEQFVEDDVWPRRPQATPNARRMGRDHGHMWRSVALIRPRSCLPGRPWRSLGWGGRWRGGREAVARPDDRGMFVNMVRPDDDEDRAPVGGEGSSSCRTGFGTIISFDVRGDAAAADAVCSRVRLIHHATSLGAVESTMERRAGVAGQEHPPPSLLRLSIGVENAEDLWADLASALQDQ